MLQAAPVASCSSQSCLSVGLSPLSPSWCPAPLGASHLQQSPLFFLCFVRNNSTVAALTVPPGKVSHKDLMVLGLHVCR